MNYRYSAKFINLATVHYKLSTISGGGGTGDGMGGMGGPMMGGDPMDAPMPAPTTFETKNFLVNTVNIEKPFVCAQVYNLNSFNKIVSVSFLKSKGNTLIDPLSFAINIDSPYTPNNSNSSNIKPMFYKTVLSDNLLLMSDLSDLEIPAGVFQFERYVYPAAGDLYTEDQKVTQYLLYFEKI